MSEQKLHTHIGSKTRASNDVLGFGFFGCSKESNVQSLALVLKFKSGFWPCCTWPHRSSAVLLTSLTKRRRADEPDDGQCGRPVVQYLTK